MNDDRPQAVKLSVPQNGEAPQDEVEALAQRVDNAVQSVRQLSDEPRRQALALKEALEAFHKYALTRLVRRLKADPIGKELLFAMVDDPAIRTLFAMHGIIRIDPEPRVAQALTAVRPYMQGHGGDVELVEVQGDRVYVRLHGACNGCSMSAVTLRTMVEEAIFAVAPEIKVVEVLPNQPTPAIIPLESLFSGSEHSGWAPGPLVEEIPPNRPTCIEINGVRVLIINSNSRFSAFRNACAHQGQPLDAGFFDPVEGVLTCPWHGWRYDAASGECLTMPAAQLESFPLRIETGRLWIRCEP